MKLRHLFTCALASVMVFMACEQEKDLGTPNVTLSTSEIILPQGGGDTTLTIIATRDWSVKLDEAADWLVVDPSSGSASASEQTVTVSALSNDGYDREASVGFTIGMQTKYLTVKQAGPKGSADALVIYSNDYDKEVAQKTYGSGTSWPYLDQFEGWKNQKGTGAANVTYAFSGMSARSNSTSDSSYSDYAGSGNNNMFFGKSAYLATHGIALGEATDLELTFGTEKYSQDNGSLFKNEEFHIWLSADGGAKWVELTDYTFAGGTTEGRWNVATANFSVPAGTAALSICMAVDVASSYRMDDFKLVASAEKGTAVDFSKAVAKDFGAGSTGGGNTGGDNTGGSTQTWPTDVYTKVSQVTSGKKYVIFAEGIVAKPIEASRTYGYLFENSVTPDSEGKITTSDEYGFVFTAVEGGYTIMQSDGRFLYVADDDYKNFNVSKEPTSGHVWKVEAQSDGTFKITNVLAPKWIQFSSNYNSYGAYRETQDASFLPYLYEGTKDLTVQEGDNTGGGNTGGGNTGGGNTGDEVENVTPVVTLTFPDENSSENKVSSYSTEWVAKSGDYEWSINGFNNNGWNNDWSFIRCGNKKDAITGVITTTTPIAESIGVVVANFSKADTNLMKTSTLEVASDVEFTTVVETVTVAPAAGNLVYELKTPVEGHYFRLSYPCDKGSNNGFGELTKVVYGTISE